MMDVLMNLVGILLQCICTSNHVIHFKYVIIFVCQSYLNNPEKKTQQLSLDYLVCLAHRKGSINVTSLKIMTIMISLDIQCTLCARHCAGAGNRWRADTGLFLMVKTMSGKRNNLASAKKIQAAKGSVGWERRGTYPHMRID